MFEKVFLLETDDQNVFLVYAPEHQAIFATNRAGAAAMQQLQTGSLDTTNPMYSVLAKKGLNQSPPSVVERKPHADITICPTFRCKLRCEYCFSNGGERSDDLTYEAGRAAIDFGLTRNQQYQIETSRLTLHGGGEPTLAWPLIKDLTDYHRMRARQLGIQPSLSIVSNGLWSRKVFAWVIATADRVSISCDGMQEVQNLHRPLEGNAPSAPPVYRTLKRLAESGVNFGIRSTITEHNVRLMPAMVHFFHELCQPKLLQFERLAICGRAEDTKIKPGSAEDFIRYFIEAADLATSLEISLSCSGIRIFRRSNQYCGAAGSALCVTPEGLFTTCHRVDNLSDPLADEFIFGKSDGQTTTCNQSHLDDLKQRLSVENNPHCQNCFCKHTCAGGCYAARFTETGSLTGQSGSERCKITRELTRYQLIQLAKQRGLFKLRGKEEKDEKADR